MLPEKRREEKSKRNSISASGDDVVIPESMQSPAVLKAAAFWFQHLDVVAPEKVPIANSPQLQAFWNDAREAGRMNLSGVSSIVRAWLGESEASRRTKTERIWKTWIQANLAHSRRIKRKRL
ncbi:MAG: hypothetical protein IPL86_19240 [Flavobacteriales bacterium]|nr:hypothetical protein [Flavobacteriales bacterium]